MADRSGYIGRAPGDSSVVVARQTFSPTGIQTDFTFASGYVVGYLDLYLNGARLIEGQDFTATDGSVVGLTTYAQNGDVLELVAYKAFNATNVQSAGGDFSVGGNLSVTGTSALTGNATVGSAITMYASAGIVSATQFFADGVLINPGAAGTWASYDSNTGISTTKKVKIENNLEVTGAGSTFSGNLTVGGVLTYDDVTNVDSIGIITARSDISIADKIIHTGDTNTAIRFPANDTFTVETAGTERLRVDSNGRIGVGTVGPTHLLHVYDGTDNSAQRNDVQAYTGGITIQNQSEVFDAFAALRFNFHGDDSYYLKARRINNNNGEFEIGQNYSSTSTDNIAIKIDNSLNVGIGSTVPVRKLDVNGIARFVETIEGFDTSGGSRDWFLSSASFGFHDGNGVGFDAGGGLFRLAISGTERVRVNSNGDVNITGVGTAIQWDATSDITLKENIEIINEPIVKLSQLKGVTFDWKFGGHSVGVIAQDVEKVLPTAVGGSKDQKTVNYNAIIGLLVESVKDQQKQIEELKSLLDK
jgi:hypothetical protein